MKKFSSLFLVLTFVLLSLTFTTSMAAPSAEHQSQYKSIQPQATVVAVTFEVFTPSVLCHYPVNLIDVYIEGLWPILLLGDAGNIFITYYSYLFLTGSHEAYFAPNVRKTLAGNLS